ncbi:MAG: polysaccharide lyase family protein [bacterium]
MMKKTISTAIAVLFALAAIGASAAAQEKTGLKKVWTIGKVNGGYYELSAKSAREWMKSMSSAFPSGFDYNVGKKGNKDAFPGFQPGPDAVWAGAKTYPLRINFPIAGIKPGGYILTVGIAGASSTREANLELAAGGKTQSLPVLPGEKDDILNSSMNIGADASKNQTLYYYIASESLRAGDNTITLTLKDGPWIVYDYISLESVPDSSKPAIMNFAASFPPFLLRNGDNEERPLRVTCLNPGPALDAALTVKIGDSVYNRNIKLNSGNCDFQISLPDAAEPADTAVRITSGGAVIAQSSQKITPARRVTVYLMPHSHLDIGYPDIQPNIVIDQRTFLENALDVIEQKHKYPMTWVVESSWPLKLLLNGIGPWEEYGPSIMKSPLLTTVPESFWKDSMKMKNVAFSASVASSASGGSDSLNDRRLVDASPFGWFSTGPAAGAWIEMSFKQPRPIKFIAIRHGRDDNTNEIKSMKITFSGPDGKTETKSAGPLPEERERLLVPVSLSRTDKIRIDITDAANPDLQATLMEIEAYIDAPIADTQRRAVKAIRDGRMDVSGLYMNFLTQLIPTEWLIRSMMQTHAIAEKTGASFKTALITDVPGFTFALPDVFSGSGIRYFYTGINDYHAEFSIADMPRAFWWQGPGGGKILVFRSFDNYNEGFFKGFTRSAGHIERLFPDLLKLLDTENYPYDTMPIRTLGDLIDDGPIPEILPEVVEEWNSRWAWPRVVIGLPTDYFAKFEKSYGGSLRTLKGDWTAYWEDGEGSTAAETTVVRRAQRSLLEAAAFGAVRDRLLGPSPEFIKTLAKAEEDVYLFDEHTWGAAGSVNAPKSPQTIEQWRFKQLPAVNIENADLFNGILPLINKFAPAPKRGGKILAAVNNSGALRSARVYFSSDQKSIKVIDAETGGEIMAVCDSGRTQTTVANAGAPKSATKCEFTFVAKNVPAMGVRYYEILPGAAVSATKAVSENTLENNFYRIVVDEKTGAITSLFDKQLGRELTDSAAGYKLNEFIYIDGKDYTNQTRISGVSVVPGQSNVSFSEIVVSGVATNFKSIRQTIRLYNDAKLVEFINELKKEETLNKEGAYFAFPLNAPGGEVRLEVTGGVMSPEKDQLPGACRDWISIQDGLAAVSDDYSILLSTPDAPLIVPEAIETLSYRRKLKLNNTSVFSYIFNNYWDTNYKASQGGDFTFRYSLTSRAGRAKDSDIINFGRDAAGMPALWAAKPAGAASAKGVLSFLSVEPANVRVLGVKTSRDGKGIVVRMQEMDGKIGNVKLTANPLLKITSAERANLVEVSEKKLAVERGKNGLSASDKINAYGLLTIILK